MAAPDRTDAYVALGANLGDREGALRFAREQLAALPETAIIGSSGVAETAPVGPAGQGPYLNQMLLLRTRLTARALLAACQDIERRRGRVRAERWGPRTLDLDIVRFGNQVIDEPDLTIPHPGLAQRAFWQREIAEIESDG